MFLPLPDESHQKIIKRRRPASGQVTKCMDAASNSTSLAIERITNRAECQTSTLCVKEQFEGLGRTLFLWLIVF